MSNETDTAAEELPLEGTGQRLKRAREDKGLTLERVAEETKIPQRHLDAIERDDFAALPSRTYAIGFSRTYARMLGLDDDQIVSELRAELAEQGQVRAERVPNFEPGDPAKVPSRGLAWAMGLAGVLLVVGSAAYFASYTGIGRGPDPLAPEPEAQLAGNQNEADTAGAASTQGINGEDGQVVFTALEDGVWVRFYDAQGERLLEKQMASGERFEIPSDAQSPQIWTGRPDAFAITIDGRSVPKLAEDDFVMRDVAISAEALLARADEPDGPSAN